MMGPDDTLKIPVLFDAELDPYADTNVRAARELGLKYDPRIEMYVDALGYAVRDRQGQLLVLEGP